jgi:uncharacterized protein (TIGR00661 family)
MARILYGVAGEGSGHSSRAKEVITHLLAKGHEVKIVSYDRGYQNLKQHFSVEEIFGLSFDYKNNKVRVLPTIIKNAWQMPAAKKSLDKVLRLIKEFKPQIVISDFEPLSCLAANLNGLPLISIDNQHRLTNAKIEYPKQYETDAALARAVTRLLIFNTKACLIISFDKPKTLNKKTFIFPPILRNEVLKAKSSDGDYILVYVTTPSKSLVKILEKINKKFVCYGFDKNEKQGNVTFKKASQEEFLKDLAGCEAIVANAGFTLISEALFLRKPYLAWPVAGQFEQILNACFIDNSGYGLHADNLSEENIRKFLGKLDQYKKEMQHYKKEDNHKIFAKLDQLIRQYAK